MPVCPEFCQESDRRAKIGDEEEFCFIDDGITLEYLRFAKIIIFLNEINS
jgi:hypothetical protein